MKYDARDFAVIHATEKGNWNEALHFAEDGSVIATNGHIVAIASSEERTADIANGEVIKPFTIEKGAADSFLAQVKKMTRKDGSGAGLDLDATNENGHARFETMGGAVELPKRDGDYVDWQAVASPEVSSAPDRQLGISLAVLENIVAVARQFSQTSKGKGQCVKFSFSDCSDGQALSLKPFTVECDKGDGRTLKIIAMPMRLK